MHKYAYTLDSDRLKALLSSRGISGGLSNLANMLGVHRNTLGHFITGSSVFPKSLIKLFEFLDVDGRELIQKKVIPSSDAKAIKSIMSIVDELIKAHPNCCIVLFGSRAKGTNRKFSDFDIGIFSKDGLEHKSYLKLVNLVQDLTEDFPYIVQLVNLVNADKDFLLNISCNMKFLAGLMSDWVILQEKSNGKI